MLKPMKRSTISSANVALGGPALGMRKIMRSALVASLALAGGCAPEPAAPPVPRAAAASVHGIQVYANVDMPVLCSWILDLTAEQYGRECAALQDHALQAELRSSIGRIDRFIISNSSTPLSQTQLEGRKKEMLRDVRNAGSVCKAVNAAYYTMYKQAGPKAVRAGTDALFSVPREPVLQPCF